MDNVNLPEPAPKESQSQLLDQANKIDDFMSKNGLVEGTFSKEKGGANYKKTDNGYIVSAPGAIVKSHESNNLKTITIITPAEGASKKQTTEELSVLGESQNTIGNFNNMSQSSVSNMINGDEKLNSF